MNTGGRNTTPMLKNLNKGVKKRILENPIVQTSFSSFSLEYYFVNELQKPICELTINKV